MKSNIYLFFLVAFGIALISCDDDPTNPEPTNYSSVDICGKTWMDKNLKVEHYKNGDKIPQVTDPTQWANLTTGAWCYYNNDPLTNNIYGKLYNWYAVNDPRGLAPEGWHIPSFSEYEALANCLGGWEIAGGKMKAGGTDYWLTPNTAATNETGFSGLPGGSRGYTGDFKDFGKGGCWWTSTESAQLSARYWYLGYNVACFGPAGSGKTDGYSVRCVKD